MGGGDLIGGKSGKTIREIEFHEFFFVKLNFQFHEFFCGKREERVVHLWVVVQNAVVVVALL